MRVLRIARTWSGALLPEAERATLALGGDSEVLRLEVEAPFRGDPPPPGPPGPTDRLWEHEVVELFVVGAPGSGGPRYTEIELGPHGHHLVIQLEGVRRPERTLLPLLRYEARITGGRWQGVAEVARALLPPRPERCNAYRIAGVGAARRYLAMRPVPGPAPDFHRLEHFAPWPG